MTTVVFDLDEIIEQSTLQHRNRDEYKVRCPECNTWILQFNTGCVGCGIGVEWLHSRVFKRSDKGLQAKRRALVGVILKKAHERPELFIDSALAEILELAKGCS